MHSQSRYIIPVSGRNQLLVPVKVFLQFFYSHRIVRFSASVNRFALKLYSMLGKRIGQYQITGILAHGGMATIYSAIQISVGREIALKAIPVAAVANDPTFVPRFEREAKLSAGLQHPNIFKVFDYGQDQDLLYFAMELYAGGTLLKLIRSGRLTLERAMYLTEQIGSALDYVHQRGIIHRDLKPSNILIDELGNAILTDFGVARIQFGVLPTLTATGYAMGTPAYMAPERWAGDTDTDHRSDIYAFGMLIYEMLTGSLPFKADDTPRVIYWHLHLPPPTLENTHANLPSAVDTVLAKSLAKEPADRYNSAGELAQAFRSALNEIPTDSIFLPLTPTKPNSPTPAIPSSLPDETLISEGAAHPESKQQPQQQEAAGATIASGRVTRRSPFPNRAVWISLVFLLAGALLILALSRGNDPSVDAQNGTNTALALLTPDSVQLALLTLTREAATVTATSTVTATASPSRTPTSTISPSPTQRAVAHILFTSSESGVDQVWIMNADGSQPTQLTSSGVEDNWSKWSPDRSQIIFATYRRGVNEIWVMEADGSNPRALTSGRNDWDPVYSPDGSQIAFVSQRDGNREIYMMNADGSNQRRLTNDRGQDWFPSWTPDGMRIVFQSNRNGNFDIFSIEITAGDLQQLVASPADDTHPEVSPDGSLLAFTSNRDGNDEIYVMPLNGGEVQRLTQHTARDQTPVWSPDGQRIAFASTRLGKFAIFRMDADGNNVMPLTDGQFACYDPSW